VVLDENFIDFYICLYLNLLHSILQKNHCPRWFCCVNYVRYTEEFSLEYKKLLYERTQIVIPRNRELKNLKAYYSTCMFKKWQCLGWQLSYFGEQLTCTLVEDWTQKHLHDVHGLQPLWAIGLMFPHFTQWMMSQDDNTCWTLTCPINKQPTKWINYSAM